jgi:hypothetical protein
MSYRPHGRAEVNREQPRAWGVCDRCGFLYNHTHLRWQYDWRGAKLQNLRFLVCEHCYDAYQQNGQRTIILPADPVPIQNARPEYYVGDNNPLSALGANPTPTLSLFSAQTGTMINGAGIPAAFDSNFNKPSHMSAMIMQPGSSYENYVAINWAEYPAGTFPYGLDTPVIRHTLTDWVIQAPNDSTFGSSVYVIQGSNAPTTSFLSWTTLDSGGFFGLVGERRSGTATAGGAYQFHRVAFYGGVGDPIAVAQVQFNVLENATMVTS